MKKSLLLCLFILISLSAFSKGATYHYFLTGTAYSKNKELLRNQTLVFEAAGSTGVFKTNQHGEYEVKVKRVFRCQSGAGFSMRKNRPTSPPINETTILIYGADFSVEIPNNWKKYQNKRHLERDSLTEIRDLHFINDSGCAKSFKEGLESFEKRIKRLAGYYQYKQNYINLKDLIELLPLYSDTADVKKLLGEPIDMGFDYRYLLEETGKNGCVIGAVFHINEYGKIDQKWIDEICE